MSAFAPARAALLLLLVTAAGCARELPPLPEIVVVADTDLPVPLAASRLRIDLYTEEGAWFESSDVARPDPRDWPVSFSVYSDDESRPRFVWVRLRAYPDGLARGYAGERPNTWGGPVTTPPPADSPRLLKDGIDVTPATEPDPFATIDRLALLELVPGRKRRARFTLRGACLGTSALFGGEGGPLRGAASTCLDTEKERAVIDIATIESAELPLGASLQGSWLADPPCPTPRGDEARICVPGGATIVGATDATSSVLLAALPIRTFGVHRFFLDRNEVSVGRFRDALTRGFKPPYLPVENNGPIKGTPTGFCSWSTEPMGREDFALGGVAWASARAFCQFEGGDLPTEVQWEHAATIAGRTVKARYPWGNAPPDCDRAAYGRRPTASKQGSCAAKGKLTPPPGDSVNDVSILGVVGLAGGLCEFTLDEARPYGDACWGDGPVVDPRCGSLELWTDRTLRGSSFYAEMTFMTARIPWKQGDLAGPVGFRCVYPDAEGGP